MTVLEDNYRKSLKAISKLEKYYTRINSPEPFDKVFDIRPDKDHWLIDYMNNRRKW